MSNKHMTEMYTVLFWERKHILMFLKVGLGNFLNNAEFIIEKDEEYACSYEGRKLHKM